VRSFTEYREGQQTRKLPLSSGNIKGLAPHRQGRTKPSYNDGRRLRRYRKRWKVERLFAWLHNWLEELAPHEPVKNYHHNRTGEDNADAHLKRQIMGREVVVAVTKGSLEFGPWEQIFYGEFDGRRRKRVLVKIIGE